MYTEIEDDSNCQCSSDNVAANLNSTKTHMYTPYMSTRAVEFYLSRCDCFIVGPPAESPF